MENAFTKAREAKGLTFTQAAQRMRGVSEQQLRNLEGIGATRDTDPAHIRVETALEIIRQKLPHPPLTLFLSVQEELGLLGMKNAKLSALGRPRLAFNFDGGPCEQLTIGATGGYRMAAAACSASRAEVT